MKFYEIAALNQNLSSEDYWYGKAIIVCFNSTNSYVIKPLSSLTNMRIMWQLKKYTFAFHSVQMIAVNVSLSSIIISSGHYVVFAEKITNSDSARIKLKITNCCNICAVINDSMDN